MIEFRVSVCLKIKWPYKLKFIITKTEELVHLAMLCHACVYKHNMHETVVMVTNSDDLYLQICLIENLDY